MYYTQATTSLYLLYVSCSFFPEFVLFCLVCLFFFCQFETCYSVLWMCVSSTHSKRSVQKNIKFWSEKQKRFDVNRLMENQFHSLRMMFLRFRLLNTTGISHIPIRLLCIMCVAHISCNKELDMGKDLPIPDRQSVNNSVWMWVYVWIFHKYLWTHLELMCRRSCRQKHN